MGALVAGRYEIVRELGRGAMAQVLLARQQNLGRLVVLKRVLPDSSARTTEALSDEARVAARLHHPCIVGVIDVHRDGESVIIAMEYVPGVMLRDMIATCGPASGLPPQVALTIAQDVLRGLSYAHSVRQGAHAGVVHRDVKPRNIVVTFAGDTKLIDFGISRWLSDDGAWDATSISGTYGYMPPEQEHGGRVDARADQYAVGVTLREMLTGQPPPTRGHSAPTAPARAPTAKLGLDDELEKILTRACAEQPDDRYASCAEMATALTDYAAARTLVLSPAQVEKWLRAHMAERLAAWEAEAERESEPRLDASASLDRASPTVTASGGTEHTAGPPTEHTSPPTVTAGEARPPVRRSRPNRRGTLVALAAMVSVAAVITTVALWPRSAAPAPPRVVELSATTASADDAWLALATQHLTERALRDAEPRLLWVATPGDVRPAVHIELAVEHTADTVRITARRLGTLDPIATVAGTSVIESTRKLAPLLGRALGSHTELGPDDDELAAMKRIGARSFAEFRRFRILEDEMWTAGAIDSAGLREAFVQLSNEDPSWPRPYAAIYMMSGAFTKDAGAGNVAAQARAKADPARDPVALKALDALVAIADERYEEAAAIAEPLFKEHDDDVLVGQVLAFALPRIGRDDEMRAVFRRLHEVRPELSFAREVAIGLQLEGREVEAEEMLRQATSRTPEGLGAMHELIMLEAKRGDRASAQRDARRMLLIHGERPSALAELYEAAAIAGDLGEAQRIADKMLLASPTMRARGRYASAVLAVLGGRFVAARQLAAQTVEDYQQLGGGFELAMAHSLLREVGDPATAMKSLDALIAWGKEVDPIAGALFQFEKALAERGTTCPVIDPLLASVRFEERPYALRTARRLAANVGCTPCKDVVADGMASMEDVPVSIVAFGKCAYAEGELVLAKRAFELASRRSVTETSPYYIVLAHFYLARTLTALGEHAAAKAEYEQFLRHWEHADRTIPEVDEARRSLAH